MAVLYIDEKLLQYLEHVLAGVLLILHDDGLDKILYIGKQQIRSE